MCVYTQTQTQTQLAPVSARERTVRGGVGGMYLSMYPRTHAPVRTHTRLSVAYAHAQIFRSDKHKEEEILHTKETTTIIPVLHMRARIHMAYMNTCVRITLHAPTAVSAMCIDIRSNAYSRVLRYTFAFVVPRCHLIRRDMSSPVWRYTFALVVLQKPTKACHNFFWDKNSGKKNLAAGCHWYQHPLGRYARY